MSYRISFSPKLSARRLLIDFNEPCKRAWNNGDALTSAVMNAFSMSFPVGEEFFIQTAKDAVPALPNGPSADALRESIKGFIAQESTHRHIHNQYNKALADLGYTNHIEGWVRADINEERERAERHGTTQLSLLAMVAGYEHMTSVLSRSTILNIDTEADWLAQADEPHRTMWRWHAAEEVEHRSVAFDLYYTLGGTLEMRRSFFVKLMRSYSWQMTKQVVSILRADKQLFKFQTLRSAASFLFGKYGIISSNWAEFKAYMRPDFHPENDDAAELALAWLAKNQNQWQPVGPAANKT